MQPVKSQQFRAARRLGAGGSNCGGGRFGLQQHHFVSRHAAGKLELRGRCLLKRHLGIDLQHSALQLERQTGGPIGQIRLQIKIMQRQLGFTFVRLGKRCAFGCAVKPAAIELEGQVRRGFNLKLGRQIAQKWHGQMQLAQLLGLVHRLVDKIDAAAGQFQVVKPKLLWLAVSDRSRGFKPRQNVVDVVMPSAQMRQ